MEWVETTADTLEAAKEKALDQLGVHPDDAEFELLNDARTGLFGRIKDPARVRARVRPRAPRPKVDRRRKGAKRGSREGRHGRGARGKQASQDAGRRQDRNARRDGGGSGSPSASSGDSAAEDRAGPKTRGSRGRTDAHDDSKPRNSRRRSMNTVEETANQPSMSLDEQADVAQAFVEGLAERFGASVDCEREYVEEREIRITVLGDDLGRMVGRGGATARAIDDLVRTVLQRRAGSSRNGWVRVDVGGVRARRVEFLARFCREQAQAVRETGVARVLEPMGAADRKIVHDTIGAEEGVSSVSEGVEPARRVAILPAMDDD